MHTSHRGTDKGRLFGDVRTQIFHVFLLNLRSIYLGKLGVLTFQEVGIKLLEMVLLRFGILSL